LTGSFGPSVHSVAPDQGIGTDALQL